MAKQQIPSEEKKNLILEIIDDRKAENPVVIDLREKVNIADFFIICTGLAVPHIRAISEHVLDTMEDHNIAKPSVSGEEVAEWVLVDFGDVILHIMSEEARERYKLEVYWTTVQPKGALPPHPGSLPTYPLDRVIAPTAENQPAIRDPRDEPVKVSPVDDDWDDDEAEGDEVSGSHEFGEFPTEADWSDDELDDWDDDDEEDDADGTETFFRVADEAVAPVDEPKED
ncbi:MAG: ribosome silencing factor [Armatimonadota bacterium]